MELSIAAIRESLGPKDWCIAQLSDLFSFSGGFTASRDQLSTSVGVPYLHYGDIHGSTKNYINVRDEYLDIPKLNVNLNRVRASSFLKTGDVVFVDASEDDDGTSRHIVVVNTDNLPFISGLHTVTAKSTSSKLSNNFRRYLFQSENVRKQFKFYAVGSKVSGVSKGRIGRIRVAFPESLVEQEAIAEVLSDADAYITSLEQLIAKKHDIKQGAMQELLSGHSRLPGFAISWISAKLSDVAEIRSGGTPSSFVPEFWNGTIPWCTPTDITALCDRRNLRTTTRRISEQGLRSSSAELIPADSIVMTSRATIGECAINRVSVTTNQGFKNFTPYTGFDVDFLYYLLQMQTQPLIALCGGSTFLEISKAQLSQYTVVLPASKSEQVAIASVLSDIDLEMAELELKRDKATAVKQGMMQELLTGRTRLI